MAPAWGHVLLQRAELHPTALLICWLCAIVAIQFFGYPLILGLAVVIALFGRDALPSWWQYISRVRWLLLALWLVLAYGAPGDALFDQDWLPTWAGVDAANLQALRLILILGCLAWLFNLLGRNGLMVALLGLLWPLRRQGGDIDRLVVRLSLVLDHLKTPPRKGAWRQMLHDQALPEGPENIVISLPAWRSLDTAAVGLLTVALVAGMVL